MRLGRWFERDFQGECSAKAGSLTLDAKHPSEFLGSKRAAVQPKAVALCARREPVVENARQVCRGYPDAIVNNGNFHASVVTQSPNGDLFVGAAGFVAGVLGIAN